MLTALIIFTFPYVIIDSLRTFLQSMALLKTEVEVSETGQLDIPNQLRQRLNLRPGDRLIVRIEDEKLIFEKAEKMIDRLQERFAHLKGQGLVDELIAERRVEADKEI